MPANIQCKRTQRSSPTPFNRAGMRSGAPPRATAAAHLWQLPAWPIKLAASDSGSPYFRLSATLRVESNASEGAVHRSAHHPPRRRRPAEPAAAGAFGPACFGRHPSSDAALWQLPEDPQPWAPVGPKSKCWRRPRRRPAACRRRLEATSRRCAGLALSSRRPRGPSPARCPTCFLSPAALRPGDRV